MSVSPLFAVEAEELLLQGKAQEAIELVQEGLAEYPKYASAFGILAKAYKMVGNELDANEILESAVYSFPQSKTLKAILDPSSLKQPKEFNIEKAIAIRSKRFHIQTETPISSYFTEEVKVEPKFSSSKNFNEIINLEHSNEIHFENEVDEFIKPTFLNRTDLTNKKLSQSINSKTYSLIPYPKNIPEFYFSNSYSSLFHFIEFPEFDLPQLVDSYDNFEESNSDFLNIDDSIETYNTILANKDLLDDEIDFDTINFDKKSELESPNNELSEIEELDNTISAYNTMLKFDPINQNINSEESIEIDKLNDSISTFNTVLTNKDILENNNFINNEIELIEDILGLDSIVSEFDNIDSNDDTFEDSYDEIENKLNSDSNQKITDVFKEIIKADVDPRMSLKEIGEELSEFSNDEQIVIEDLEDFATETLAEIYIEQGAYQDAIDIFNKLILISPDNIKYYQDRIELINQNM